MYHRCPGCVARIKDYFACPDCWESLPEEHRLLINRAGRRRNPNALAGAMAGAVAWYQQRQDEEAHR